jgi:hypothetical protein
MSMTKDQAVQMADRFAVHARALKSYRMDHWEELSPLQRRELRADEITLRNHANNLITVAVGLSLHDLQGDLAAIERASEGATKVVQTIHAVESVLLVSAGLVALAGSIASLNPGSIAKAAGALLGTVKKVLKDAAPPAAD